MGPGTGLALGIGFLAACAGPHRPARGEPAAGLARVALAAPGVHWDSVIAPSLTVYVQPGDWAAARREALRARAEAALSHALRLLDEPVYPARLRVFYFASKEAMTRAIGRGHNGTTDVEGHGVFLVANGAWHPFERHETMHAVSLGLWGEPGAPTGEAAWRRAGWLREGLAAAAEDRCGRYHNRGVAAAMQAGGEGLSLAELVGRFYEQDDLAAYLQAGSLVEYLIRTYGIVRFRRLWRAGGDGIAPAFGKPAFALEAEWRAWLAAAPVATRPPNLAALRRGGCGAAPEVPLP